MSDLFKVFVVHEQVYHDVLAYLVTKPHAEVSALVAAMRDCDAQLMRMSEGCEAAEGEEPLPEERYPAIGFDCAPEPEEVYED